MRVLALVWFGCIGWMSAIGQDPFFIQFTHAESAFNPSLTGYRGALSLMAKYKSQWMATPGLGFQTFSLDVEESLPCSVVDYGFHLGADQEGSGLLRTTDFGGRVAGTIAFDTGPSTHNVRVGLALLWGAKRVDYSRLVFSDQLDPKYGTQDANGLPNPTAFIPANDGRSLWFFMPAVGFTHRILLNRSRFRSPTVLYGVAVHNAFSLGGGAFGGNVESILDQDTPLPVRWHAFASAEFVLFAENRTVITARPLAVFQQQGPIRYTEWGSRFSLNRNLAVGLSWHSHWPTTGTDDPHTDWISLQGEFGAVINRTHRLEFGVSYAGNVSGLRNQMGPILEFSVGWHLARSPSCQLWGFADEVPYGDQIRCPTSSLTPGRRKMYEGIWYQ